MSKYDSRRDTLRHINRVQELLAKMAALVAGRQIGHDASKLVAPEKEIFDEYTPKLKNSTYGSPEYAEFLIGMGEALEHHYANNRHHPEHFEDGIKGMNLIDLVEMFVDWKAATERHADGDLTRSIETNQARFSYSDDLKAILLNSVALLEEPKNG